MVSDIEYDVLSFFRVVVFVVQNVKVHRMKGELLDKIFQIVNHLLYAVRFYTL